MVGFITYKHTTSKRINFGPADHIDEIQDAELRGINADKCKRDNIEGSRVSDPVETERRPTFCKAKGNIKVSMTNIKFDI